MSKSKLYLSFFSWLLSIFIFITVAFAWFTLSINVNISPIDLVIRSGMIKSYEIHFFTYDKVYKYTSSSLVILMYDEDTDAWIIPTYDNPDDQPFNFSGIIMNQYDPLIMQNNLYNNMIIELHIQYEVNVDTSAALSAVANQSISQNARSIFLPDTAYFLSKYAYLQNIVTSDFAIRGEGANLYDNLTTKFAETDTGGNLISPLVSFYGSNDTYSSNISFEPLYLSASSSELYIYFNISYYENKIVEDFFTPMTTGSSPIRFFQDITFSIRKESFIE